MAQGKNIHELETKLGYCFKNCEYLLCALTHPSYANEQRSKGVLMESYERLEFLGDAVLQIVISEHLYKTYTKRREGALTSMRQRLVCEKTLAKIAAELELNDYLCLGHGEEISDCRNRPKVLAECLEAIIAAIYLDAEECMHRGFSDVVLKLFYQKISEIADAQDDDYKSMLQQFSEQDGFSELRYESTQTGKAHEPEFTSTAYINNNAVGHGTASSKKDAEMSAAKEALELFGII